MKISDIAGERRDIEIDLGGRKITARPLLNAEHKAISAAFPPPRPPMMKDPTRGSDAPKIPNLEDADYIEADNAWYERAAVMRLAVAIGLEPEGQPAWSHRLPPEQRRAWLEAAERELDEHLTKAEMDTLRRQYARPTLDSALAEAGEGNSGGGQQATAD